MDRHRHLRMILIVALGALTIIRWASDDIMAPLGAVAYAQGNDISGIVARRTKTPSIIGSDLATISPTADAVIPTTTPSSTPTAMPTATPTKTATSTTTSTSTPVPTNTATPTVTATPIPGVEEGEAYLVWDAGYEGHFDVYESHRVAENQNWAEMLRLAYHTDVDAPLPVLSAKPRLGIITYTVQPGDTVFGIADKFNISPDTVLGSNDALEDDPHRLQIGQKIVVLPVSGVYHTVRSGDTIAGIAKKYKVESQAILSYKDNGLAENASLAVGQKLVIPGGVKPYVPKKVYTTFTSSQPKGGGAVNATNSFGWPVTGYISQGYWNRHRAIDIAAPKGTPIYAADAGYVAMAGWSNVGYGYMLVIDHGNGYQTLYAHLSRYEPDAGDPIAKGEMIGRVGSTGWSTGPHLHFEIRKGGVQLNPLGLLPSGQRLVAQVEASSAAASSIGGNAEENADEGDGEGTGMSPMKEQYTAPQIISPENETMFLEGELSEIVLSWKREGELGVDDYYAVTVFYNHDGREEYTGKWVKETQWRLPENLFGIADHSTYRWYVTVMRRTETRSDGGFEGNPLSPPSETKSFIWR